MKVLKIIKGFVTNSSSYSAPLTIALKSGLEFSDILRKLGYDISQPYVKKMADELDYRFGGGDGNPFLPKDDNPLTLKDKYSSGYQIGTINVMVQVDSGGGWIDPVDGFLKGLGWDTDENFLKGILEDDLVIIKAGDVSY